MKIKQKILLSLSMLVVMIGTAFAGPYEQPGSIGWVRADGEGHCTLAVVYKSSPGSQQLGEWKCKDLPGKMILDTAKTALILDRPVVVTFMGSSKEKNQY